MVPYGHRIIDRGGIGMFRSHPVIHRKHIKASGDLMEIHRCRPVGVVQSPVVTAAVQLQGRHGETAVLEILSGSSRIRPVWEDGALRGLKVSAEARADILELGGRGALRGAEDGDWLTAQLEAKLSQ